MKGLKHEFTAMLPNSIPGTSPITFPAAGPGHTRRSSSQSATVGFSITNSGS